MIARYGMLRKATGEHLKTIDCKRIGYHGRNVNLHNNTPFSSCYSSIIYNRLFPLSKIFRHDSPVVFTKSSLLGLAVFTNCIGKKIPGEFGFTDSPGFIYNSINTAEFRSGRVTSRYSLSPFSTARLSTGYSTFAPLPSTEIRRVACSPSSRQTERNLRFRPA